MQYCGFGRGVGNGGGGGSKRDTPVRSCYLSGGVLAHSVKVLITSPGAVWRMAIFYTRADGEGIGRPTSESWAALLFFVVLVVIVFLVLL